MSKPHITSFTCPNCGQTFEFEQWNVINAVENPEASEKLLHGALFHQTCPHCGKQLHIVYTCLYTNHDKKFVISLQPQRDQPAATPLMPHYTMRLEHTLADFVERARILDAGLDDMALEMLRMVLLAQIQKKFPDRNITSLRFDNVQNDEIYFQIDPQNPRDQVKIPMPHLWRMEDKLKDSGLRPKLSGYVVMNAKWVQQSGILNCLLPKKPEAEPQS